MKIFVINGGQKFAHSNGSFNASLTCWTKEVIENLGFDIRITHVNEEYNKADEVENFKWADVIIYHTPIWWFQVPNRLKLYIDEVFTEGYQVLYKSDGRSHVNPAINYGTGGLLQNKYYMLTSTWNAPEEAFTLENEFFDQTSVDDGILFGLHKMNQFLGLKRLDGMHFHDLEKNETQDRVDQYEIKYKELLKNTLKDLK